MLKTSIRQRLFNFNTFRRAVQFISFLLFSAMVFNLGSLPMVLPVMWTLGYQPNTVGDALTALQLMFSGWQSPVVFPWLAVASFLLVGVLIGKSLCGWVCPFGFIQDLVGFVKVKKTEVSLKTHRNMTLVKYFILGIVLFISLTFSAAKVTGAYKDYERALGIFAYAPFTAISPAETLFSTLPRGIQSFSIEIMEKPVVDVLSGVLDLPPLFWVQLFILIGVIVLAAYIPRGWCRYLCPHGAIMAFLNRFSFLGLRRDPVRCVKGECRECVKVCPMMVPILELPWEKFSHSECIYCMKCSDACPHKAIRLKYP
ncbi:MAG: 4Fe-4S binding protein [Candidatus Bathyarchaeia archaeon]